MLLSSRLILFLRFTLHLMSEEPVLPLLTLVQ